MPHKYWNNTYIISIYSVLARVFQKFSPLLLKKLNISGLERLLEKKTYFGNTLSEAVLNYL